MDLITAIVDQYDNQATALRTLVGVDKMVADQDTGNEARPYIVVSEAFGEVVSEGMQQTYRVELSMIQFDCYADTRAETAAILDAIEDAYIGTQLTTTRRVVLGSPQLNKRLINSPNDCYHGLLILSYYLEK